MNQACELFLIAGIERIAENLTRNNDGALSAYPQLTGLLYNLSADLNLLGARLREINRIELLSGRSQAAMLYKEIFKRDIMIPDGVLNNSQDARWALVREPIRDIMKYAIRHRGFTTEKLDYTVDNQLVQINPADGTATVRWQGNDMSVVLKDLSSPEAEIYSPLMPEPYHTYLDAEYHRTNVIKPLLADLVKEECKVPANCESKYLLHTHYYGTFDEPKEVPNEHPVRKVYELLAARRSGSEWGVKELECTWKDYVITLNSKYDFNVVGGNLVWVTLFHPELNERGYRDTVVGWWNNPLLVNDLLDDMPGILDWAITTMEAIENA